MMLGAIPAADATLTRLLNFQTNNRVELSITQFAGQLRFREARGAEAAAYLRQSIQLTPVDDLARPGFAGVRLYLAAAEVEQGRLEAAQRVLDDFRAAVPQVRTTQAFLRWNDPARFLVVDEARLAADLAKAGMAQQ